MRLRSKPVLITPLLALSLTACSSLPFDPAAIISKEESESTTPVPVVETPVLETLVQDAAEHSEPTLPPTDPETSEEIEEAVHITTTIPMTPNRIVERTINNYLQNNRKMLQIWSERSKIYFPMIEKIFAEEGVPDELKYLAIGESGLNPTVRSSARAVGMWQFMTGTARSEGLRVDSWIDERRDPELATRAAARHIKKLNQDYNGRWHLTVAGYNCSYRCISRAVRRAGYSMDDPPSYWEIYRHLPRETRGFVPKFIAMALLVSNPEQFGIEVEDLGQELAYDVVRVKGMLSLEDAANMAGTDLPTIRKLNPSLLRSMLPDDPEPYPLKLPLGSYDLFVRNFALAAPRAASAGEYIVKAGDTLGRIASSYGITVADLQAANGIKGSLININQKLSVPGQGNLSSVEIVSTERQSIAYGTAGFKPIELGEGFTLAHQSGSTPERPLLAVSLNQNAIEPDEGAMSLVPTIYRVQSGDTLGAIAQRYGVSVASIQANNNLSSHMIYPAQELTIHSATNIVDPPKPGTSLYQVRSGDSLYLIARRFGMTVESLKRLNGLRSNLIHPGQNLHVD